MRIMNARQVQQAPSPAGFQTITRLDIAITDEVTIYHCTLVRAPDGNIMLYGPSAKAGGNVISFAPRARKEIIESALAAVGIDTNERSAA